MPRGAFDRELQKLQDEVLVLGRMVERAIMGSVQALKQHDREAARRLIAGDRAINDKRFSIESDSLALIATQQPLASDLRVIATVLEIATELERMGDYAKSTAKLTLMMSDQPSAETLEPISRMDEKARHMLAQALEAFMRRDATLARTMPIQDDEIDALHNQVYRELLSLTTTDADAIDQATQLLWVVHNLERVADRAVNICERVVFTVTGEMVEMEVDNGERPGMAGVL